jgi:hypothetical protein
MQGRSFKIAHLLARFDHVASFVVNVNYSGMGTDKELRVADCV